MMIRFVPALVLVGAASIARAGAIVWVGTTGNWNNPANWSGADVPDMLGDVAVIGTPTAVVTLDVSPTLDGVAITDAAARLNLNGRILSVLPLGLDTTGLLVANAGASSIFGNVTNTGAGAGRGIEIAGGTGLVLNSPTVANSGRIEINPTNVVSGTFLRCDVNTLLTGSGELILSGQANRAILQTVDPAAITNGSMHTIRGMGQVPAALINNGTVSADVNGQNLLLHIAAKTNNGTFEAVNNAFLDLNGITVTQGPAGAIVADAGTVRITTSTITGGAMDTLNAGTINFSSGSSTISSITSGGDIDQAGSTVVNVGGTGLHNDGRFDVNPTDVVSQTVLNYVESGLLDGLGEVVLGSTANRAILATSPGAIITHASPHVIRGKGQINAALVNNSLMMADVPGDILVLQNAAKTNNALMQAVNGSFLNILSITINQDPLAVIHADAATVQFASSTVNGGYLSTSNGGLVTATSGANSLNGVTIVGDFDQAGGSDVLVTGGLTVEGRYDVNPSNLVSQTVLQFNDSSTLAGPGEVVLGSPANRAILATAPGATLTHAASSVVRGRGQVHASLVNNGLISADVAGQLLSLQLNPKTNNAIMEAKNSATLEISNIAVTQGGAGVIAADAANTNLVNATISGGTLTTANAGRIAGASGLNVLNSVLNNATFDIAPGSTCAIGGSGLTDNGLITINPTNTVSTTVLRFDVTSNLAGTGTIVMNSQSNRAIVSTSAGVTVTQDAGHTIRGLGELRASLINNGVVQADASGHSLTLIEQSKTNNATMRAVSGANLDLSNIALTQGSGGNLSADAANIRITASSVSGGSISTANGGRISTQSGTCTFTSVTSQATLDVLASSSLFINGTGLHNDGTVTVNPNNTVSVTTMQFTASGALTGTGTVLLNSTLNRSIFTGAVGTVITQAAGHTLAGIGQMNAPNLQNSGVLAPGNPLGSLAVNGVVTQNSGSILDIELSGVGQADRLFGTGTINLGGTLRARAVDGHVPAPGAVYTVVTTSFRPGRFEAFNLPPGDWRVEYLDDSIRLKLGPHCFGDTDFNNVVNFADITEVLSNFGADYSPAPGTGPGDSTRDGLVNFADITNVLTNFALPCP